MAVIIIVGVLFLILLIVIIRNSINPPVKCSNCSTTNRKSSIINQEILKSYYKHQTIKGEADRRFKNNPKIYNIEYTYKCSKCSTEFKIVRNTTSLDDYKEDVYSKAQDVVDSLKRREIEREEYVKYIRKVGNGNYQIGLSGYAMDYLPENPLEKETIEKFKDILEIEDINIASKMFSGDNAYDLITGLTEEEAHNYCMLLLKAMYSDNTEEEIKAELHNSDPHIYGLFLIEQVDTVKL